MKFNYTTFAMASIAAIVLSACSSTQQASSAPVISGTESTGYGYNNGTYTTPYGTYNNGTVTTPQGTYSNGAVTTNSGYGYNNGTVTTPQGTYNNGTVSTNTGSVYNNGMTNPTSPYDASQTNTPPTYDQATYTNPTPTYTPAPTRAYTGNYAPVDVNATYHRVVSGDTVYNISKRYGISQDQLRAWNNLPDNNIKLGQNLRVKPTGYSASSNSSRNQYTASSGAATHRVVSGDTLYNIAKRYGVSQNQIRQWNNLQGDNVRLGQVLRVSSNQSGRDTAYQTYTQDDNPYATSPKPNAASSSPENTPPVTSNAYASGAASTTTPVITETVTTTTTAKTTNKGGITWQNPVAGGRVSQAFGGNSRGIEITGSSNQSVVAAADGQVIYSGVGPRGYGNLVVVQHNTKYLTAYGHGENLLVKEHERVKRGQSLATLGSGGKLHFEIRESGTPVNPTDYVLF